MSLVVRLATAADIPAMAAQWEDTYKDFLADTPAGFGGPLRAPDPGSWQIPWLKEVVADPDRVSLIAEGDGKMAGFLMAQIKRESDDFYEAPYLTVSHLSVDRSVRRSGIGRALMDRVLAIARERGMKAVDLEVLVRSGPAVKLYESLGFTPLTKRLAKLL